jgi:integrase/recombinase XerD
MVDQKSSPYSTSHFFSASSSALTARVPLHDYDALRDRAYRDTAMGRDVVDFLAWLELGGAAARTLDSYERDLARGCLMFPSKGMADLEDGDAFQIAKSFSPKQRRVRVAAYKSFFKWGRQMRRILSSPFDALPAIRRSLQPVIDVFTDAEVEALLSLDLIDAAPLAVLFEAGLRKGEARALQFRHCVPENGQVVVIGGKGSKDRIVPMSARLKSLLADLALMYGMDSKDHIFYSVRANERARKVMREKPIGEGTFARWWRSCLERAGTRYRVPHTARHTFATSWRRKGLSVDEIQILLGHASIATTSDLYVHTKVMDVAERMALIEAGL